MKAEPLLIVCNDNSVGEQKFVAGALSALTQF